MSLIKFNRNRFPWINEGITNFLDTDDLLTEDFFTKKSPLPAMNVKEDNDHFEVELATPGFSKEDIDITVEDDILCVSAAKSTESQENEEHYTRRDFNYNSFERKLKLPQSVDKNEEVKAAYKDGVLKLVLNKSAEEQKKQKRNIQIG